MRIQVTQEHIDRARELELANSRIYLANRCPIALAARDAGLYRASVAWGLMRVRRRFFELPQEAADFMWKFDTGLPVEPFSFNLDIEP